MKKYTLNVQNLYMEQHDYADLVAQNVRVARAKVWPVPGTTRAKRLSQSDVSVRMRALGFSSWRPQTVGATERGERRLTLEEALGLTVALETDLTALVYPAEIQPVALPNGYEVMLPAARAHHQPDRYSIWSGNRIVGWPS